MKMKLFVMATFGWTVSALAQGYGPVLNCVFRQGTDVGMHSFQNPFSGDDATLSQSGPGSTRITVVLKHGRFETLEIADSGKPLFSSALPREGAYEVKRTARGRAVSIRCEQDSEPKRMIADFLKANRGDLCRVSPAFTMLLMTELGIAFPALLNFGEVADAIAGLPIERFQTLDEVPDEQIASAFSKADPAAMLRAVEFSRAAILRTSKNKMADHERAIYEMLTKSMVLFLDLSEASIKYSQSRLAKSPDTSQRLQELVGRAKIFKAEYPRLKTQAQLWGVSLTAQQRKASERFVSNFTKEISSDICQAAMDGELN